MSTSSYTYILMSVSIVGLLPSIMIPAFSSSDSEMPSTANTDTSQTTMKRELLCESSPNSGLLCSSQELDLCLLRSDLSAVNATDQWNIMNPILCEGMQEEPETEEEQETGAEQDGVPSE